MKNSKKLSWILVFILLVNFGGSIFFIEESKAESTSGWEKAYRDFLEDYYPRQTKNINNIISRTDLQKLPSNGEFWELAENIFGEDSYNNSIYFLRENAYLANITNMSIPDLIFIEELGFYLSEAYRKLNVYSYVDGKVVERKIIFSSGEDYGHTYIKINPDGLDQLVQEEEYATGHEELKWDGTKLVGSYSPSASDIVSGGYNYTWSDERANLGNYYIIRFRDPSYSDNNYIISSPISTAVIDRMFNEYSPKGIKVEVKQEEVKTVSGARSYFDLDINQEGVEYSYEVENPEILKITSRGEIIGLKAGTTDVIITIKKEGLEDQQVRISVTIDPPLEIDYEKIKAGSGEDDLKNLQDILGNLTETQKLDPNSLLDILDLGEYMVSKDSLVNTRQTSGKTILNNDLIMESALEAEKKLDEVYKVILESKLKLPYKLPIKLIVNIENPSKKENKLIIDRSILDPHYDEIDLRLGDVGLILKKENLSKILEKLEKLEIIIDKGEKGYILNYSDGEKDISKLEESIDILIPVKTSGDTDFQVVYYENKEEIDKLGGHFEPELGQMKFSSKDVGEFYIEEDKKEFKDIDNLDDHLQEAILFMTSKGFIDGRTKDEFKPNDLISREEFTQLIIKSLYKLDRTLDTSFTDVGKEDRYHDYIASSEKEGIINGFKDGSFKGSENIDREQIIAIASRVLNDKGGFIYPDGKEEANYLLYKDNWSIANWAKREVALAFKSGLIGLGIDKKLHPKAKMTRVDAVDTIYRMFELLYRPSKLEIKTNSSSVSFNFNKDIALIIGIAAVSLSVLALYNKKSKVA